MSELRYPEGGRAARKAATGGGRPATRSPEAKLLNEWTWRWSGRELTVQSRKPSMDAWAKLRLIVHV